MDAILDAIAKAKDDVDLKDFEVVSNGLKTKYYNGEKLELKPLKLKIENKDGKKFEIKYEEFKKNGYKILDQRTGKDVTEKTEINGDMAGKSGLYLRVVHEQTGSSISLPVILSSVKKKTLIPKEIVVREKGSKEWIDTEGFELQTTGAYHLKLSDKNKEKLLGKEV